MENEDFYNKIVEISNNKDLKSLLYFKDLVYNTTAKQIYKKLEDHLLNKRIAVLDKFYSIENGSLTYNFEKYLYSHKNNNYYNDAFLFLLKNNDVLKKQIAISSKTEDDFLKKHKNLFDDNFVKDKITNFDFLQYLDKENFIYFVSSGFTKNIGFYRNVSYSYKKHFSLEEFFNLSKFSEYEKINFIKDISFMPEKDFLFAIENNDYLNKLSVPISGYSYDTISSYLLKVNPNTFYNQTFGSKEYFINFDNVAKFFIENKNYVIETLNKANIYSKRNIYADQYFNLFKTSKEFLKFFTIEKNFRVYEGNISKEITFENKEDFLIFFSGTSITKYFLYKKDNEKEIISWALIDPDNRFDEDVFKMLNLKNIDDFNLPEDILKKYTKVNEISKINESNIDHISASTIVNNLSQKDKKIIAHFIKELNSIEKKNIFK